jgi:hypothetical protein
VVLLCLRLLEDEPDIKKVGMSGYTGGSEVKSMTGSWEYDKQSAEGRGIEQELPEASYGCFLPPLALTLFFNSPLILPKSCISSSLIHVIRILE